MESSKNARNATTATERADVGMPKPAGGVLCATLSRRAFAIGATLPTRLTANGDWPLAGIALAMAFASAVRAQCVGGWTQVSNTGPGALEGVRLAYDPGRQRTVLFAGTCAGGQTTWEWDGSLWNQVASSGPAPRASYGMVYDSTRQRVVLYGGVDCIAHFEDTWEWDGIAWTMRAVSGPPSRRQHVMAFDSNRGVAVVYGGIGSNFPIKDDTWEWSGSSWTMRASGNPSRRVKAAMAFDAARSACVLFGGQTDSAGTPNRETWEWSGSNWALRSTQGPETRWGAELVYVGNSTSILFGGNAGGNPGPAMGDTWSWDGATWRSVATSGPSSRYYHAMAFDSARRRIVLFGGTSTPGVIFGDTWELPLVGPEFTQEPLGTTILSGATLTLSARATGAAPIAYRWRRNGVPMFNGGRVSGAFTDTLVITLSEPSDTGAYDAVATSEGCSIASASAEVRVYCLADVDDGTRTGTRDGGVTIDDLLYYLFIFEQGLLAADVDDGSGSGTPDGGVTIDDLLYYLFRFESGC